jgi:TetR/AcrR family transcriptional repressor of nem operon
VTADTRSQILSAARATAQAHGYNGLSFRELAKEVGVKSASIHYHFPTKGDLGAALAKLYAQSAAADLDAVLAKSGDPAARLKKYAALFRKALEKDNRMCLCGIMAAEYADLPEAVRREVGAFADLNVAWLTKVLARVRGPKGLSKERWARAIYAAIGGAQLAARGRGDIALFDEIVAAYQASGLIPA